MITFKHRSKGTPLPRAAWLLLSFVFKFVMVVKNVEYSSLPISNDQLLILKKTNQ